MVVLAVTLPALLLLVPGSLCLSRKLCREKEIMSTEKDFANKEKEIAEQLHEELRKSGVSRSVRAQFLCPLPSPPDAHLSVRPLQDGDEASYTPVRGASDALSDPELAAH